MKRIFILLAAAIIAVNTMGQETKDSMKVEINPSLSNSDSMLTNIETLLKYIEVDLSLKNRYKLYKTENLYNLLLLDTKTGMIEQVQWSLKRSNEGKIVINAEDLSYGYGYGSGSFELYPTNNMYQFILLDKTSGRTWHVQWGLEAEERWIRRIY